MIFFCVALAWSNDQNAPAFQAKDIMFTQKTGLSIQAKQIQWNLKKKQADLTGKVEVSQEGLSLVTEALSIQLDDSQRISSIVTTKPVTITHKDQKASAKVAHWDVAKDELKLEGEPTLISPQGSFSGGTIYYFPKKEEIHCVNGCSLSLHEKK